MMEGWMIAQSHGSHAGVLVRTWNADNLGFKGIWVMVSLKAHGVIEKLSYLKGK